MPSVTGSRPKSIKTMKTDKQKLTDKIHAVNTRMWMELGDDWITEQGILEELQDMIESGKLILKENN